MESENEPNSKSWLADANMLTVVLLWAVNIPVLKYVLERVDKFAVNAIRLFVSVVILGIIVWFMKGNILDRRPEAPPIKKQIFVVGLFAFFTALVYQVLFLIGIDATSAGNTAIILSAIPMWIAVLSFFFLKERLPFAAWVGLTIAFAGVVVVSLMKSQEGSSLKGNLLMSCAALGWAIGAVMSKPIMKHISPVALTFFSIAVTLPVHFWLAADTMDQVEILWQDKWVGLGLLYSGIFSTGLATAMWNIGVKQVGPSHAAGFQNLVPVIALLASWWMLGETPVVLQVLGGILIIAGLIVMRTKRS